MEEAMTEKEMIKALLDEYERNFNALENGNVKEYLERRQRFLKAQLESFGVNTENLDI